MSKAKNSTEVLQAAKWMLENIGWIQGQNIAYKYSGQEYRKIVGFCSVSAINYTEVLNTASRQLAYNYLHKIVGEPVAAFNDRPKRTKKEVIEAFDKAIKLSQKKKKGK